MARTSKEIMFELRNEIEELRAVSPVPSMAADWLDKVTVDMEEAIKRELVEATTKAATEAINLTNEKWQRDMRRGNGAGVLMIQGAEAYLQKGWAQRNLCIVATDIDYRACDFTYVQLSLLGYAAVVQQVDALALKPFDVARYTPGWFIHCFPMRGIRA